MADRTRRDMFVKRMRPAGPNGRLGSSAVLAPDRSRRVRTAGSHFAELLRSGAFRGKAANPERWGYEPKPGFLYVTNRAISSRVNANYDGWKSAELESGYRTFLRRPVYVEHHNWDTKRSRGVITGAKLHKDEITTKTGKAYEDWWVELLHEVDAVQFPRLAENIMNGNLNATSMGCEVASTTCSICANVAEVPSQFCEHIPYQKGRMVRDASGQVKLCYEICNGPYIFFEDSYVFDPADESALVSDFYLATANGQVTGVRRVARRRVDPKRSSLDRHPSARVAQRQPQAENRRTARRVTAQERPCKHCGTPLSWDDFDGYLPAAWVDNDEGRRSRACDESDTGEHEPADASPPRSAKKLRSFTVNGVIVRVAVQSGDTVETVYPLHTMDAVKATPVDIPPGTYLVEDAWDDERGSAVCLVMPDGSDVTVDGQELAKARGLYEARRRQHRARKASDSPAEFLGVPIEYCREVSDAIADGAAAGEAAMAVAAKYRLDHGLLLDATDAYEQWANPTGFYGSRTADQVGLRLPEDLDTLRQERHCPYCKTELEDNVCPDCGYEDTPEAFDDPDTTPRGDAADRLDQAVDEFGELGGEKIPADEYLPAYREDVDPGDDDGASASGSDLDNPDSMGALGQEPDVVRDESQSALPTEDNASSDVEENSAGTIEQKDKDRSDGADGYPGYGDSNQDMKNFPDTEKAPADGDAKGGDAKTPDPKSDPKAPGPPDPDQAKADPKDNAPAGDAVGASPDAEAGGAKRSPTQPPPQSAPPTQGQPPDQSNPDHQQAVQNLQTALDALGIPIFVGTPQQVTIGDSTYQLVTNAGTTNTASTYTWVGGVSGGWTGSATGNGIPFEWTDRKPEDGVGVTKRSDPRSDLVWDWDAGDDGFSSGDLYSYSRRDSKLARAELWALVDGRRIYKVTDRHGKLLRVALDWQLEATRSGPLVTHGYKASQDGVSFDIAAGPDGWTATITEPGRDPVSRAGIKMLPTAQKWCESWAASTKRARRAGGSAETCPQCGAKALIVYPNGDVKCDECGFAESPDATPHISRRHGDIWPLLLATCKNCGKPINYTRVNGWEHTDTFDVHCRDANGDTIDGRAEPADDARAASKAAGLCAGSGKLQSYSTGDLMAGGDVSRGSRAKVSCPECSKSLTGTIVRKSQGVSLGDRGMVKVPNHSTASRTAHDDVRQDGWYSFNRDTGRIVEGPFPSEQQATVQLERYLEEADAQGIPTAVGGTLTGNRDDIEIDYFRAGESL